MIPPRRPRYGLLRDPRPVLRTTAAARNAPATAGGRSPARFRGGMVSSALVFLLTHVSAVATLFVIGAHLILARPEHELPNRMLFAIPAVVLILEARRYLRSNTEELPFVLFGLFQYYLVFSFPVFFDIEFFDLDGPVAFTAQARMSAAVAIGFGGLVVWMGAFVGERVGVDLQPFVTRLLPGDKMPARADDAVFGYAAFTVGVSLLLVVWPDVVPGSIALFVSLVVSIPMALGVALALPPRTGGYLGKHLPLGLMVASASTGLLGGSLDNLARMALPYLAGQWAFFRRFSLRLPVIVVALVVMLQPVKEGFRSQVWGSIVHTGEEIGYVDRLRAWGTSFSKVWTGEPTADAAKTGAAIERLSEVGAVMHAFEVLPGRVQSLEGDGFLQVLYSPIPRFIWRDKPKSQDTVQQYGRVFGRQTERGAQSTAINLPMIVEGYWNLGWPGIFIACVASGFWLGFARKSFAGERWAMRAIGIAQVSRINIASPVVLTYSAIFQSMVGYGLVCWAVWGVAKILSGQGPTRIVGGRRAPVGRRAIPVN